MNRFRPTAADAEAARKALAGAGVIARVRRFDGSLRVCLAHPREGERALAAFVLAQLDLRGAAGADLCWNQPHEAFAYKVH
jgi:hypothetical protein